MENQDNYICKIASLDEIKKKWDYEIEIHSDNPLYLKAKEEYLKEAKKGTRIVYVGILGNEIICDVTAIIKKEGILSESRNHDDLVSDKRCFLCAFRTNKEYENKGYFSKLYKFMENDLIKKGFTEFSLSVDTSKKRNMDIYKKWNFTNFIRSEVILTTDYKYITYNYYFKKTSED